MYNISIGVMMLVKSMTGYGRDTFHIDDTTITVEIKSVNSRYLDFAPKMPRELQAYEQEIKKKIQAYFERGRIEVYVSVSGGALAHKEIQIDWELMDQYVAHLQQVKERYQLDETVPLSVIANEEALFTIQEKESSPTSLHILLTDSVERVAQKVLNNRISEGTYLMHDIRNRIRQIEEQLKEIEANQPSINVEYRKRIRNRIEDHIDKDMNINESNLIQEIAVLAERGDIQEELTRLFSHLAHFEKVAEHSSAVGRKLDFITQEMHREANTIGSKSVDASISETIVSIKSDIEKIKEQIQNIE
ncbi:MAG TPA: YicC/YloC family endoribonuclease [Pseudogracilibacillus sp.]|nr:YicC/YloC family endoribonuclease [Pseudogracilibacillus sp.]